MRGPSHGAARHDAAVGESSVAQPGRSHVQGRISLLFLTTVTAVATSSTFAQAPPSQQYRIVSGDKIGISVFGQPDLSGEATVDGTGSLRLPVIGDIPAASLTLGELEKSIGRSLEQGYV